jgi:putative acetyltransferase
MSRDEPTIRLVDAVGPEGLGHARSLFRAYAAEYAPLVAVIFDVQGFDAEVAGLPGRYAPPSGCLLLAMDGDIASGCVALRDLGDGTCEMKRLYVTSERRDLGLGRLLVDEVLRRAERMGYRRMVLDSLPEMQGALALYRRYGFVETAPYWGHPTGHAIFMEKWFTV